MFKPELKTRDELYKRFNEWVKEKDWFFWMLSNSDAIGVSVLKKLNWKDDKESPNRTPTSGLAVAERYKRNGFGYFLQKIIEYQAILYGARKIFVTIKEDNIASINVHKKSGFVETDRIIPKYKIVDGEKIFDANDIELVLRFGTN